jgi:hypothetical protein
MAFKTPLGAQELPPEKDALTPEEQEVFRKIAQKVVDWNLTVPAILFLESVKPLNYLGSQAMVFFEPFVTAIFSAPVSVREYNLFRQMMERRENVERLLQKIEEIDAIQLEKERQLKRQRKTEKKAGRRSLWKKIMRRNK